MAEERISLQGRGPFRLAHVQRSVVRIDKDGVLITLRVVGGDGTVPVNLQMVPRTALELAAQISAAIATRTGEIPESSLGTDEMVALDAWIARQPDPKPSRSDVIRAALAQWLREPAAIRGGGSAGDI